MSVLKAQGQRTGVLDQQDYFLILTEDHKDCHPKPSFLRKGYCAFIATLPSPAQGLAPDSWTAPPPRPC